MRSRARWLLLLVVGLFTWGIAQLFEARFDTGDLYPIGSSLRSDALGLRAIHDAFAEALPRLVIRHRGSAGPLVSGSDVAIIVQGLKFSRLVAKSEPLILELTQAARNGARVVVTLDDRESMSCHEAFCNGREHTRCWRRPTADELNDTLTRPSSSSESESGGGSPQQSTAASPSPPQATDTSCDDAALGLWGFEIGGTAVNSPTIAERAVAAASTLPEKLPWHGPAKFIELHPDFKIRYARQDDALVVERPLGNGSLILVGEGYLLSNEAQRNARYPELLLWLIGDKSRVIFEESHLGVTVPRGVMSLLRDLRLHGFLAGCVLLGALFAWQRLRPLSHRTNGQWPRVGSQTVGDSTLLALLRRGMTPTQAIEGCIQEARLAHLGKAVERASQGRPSPTVESFNRIFCREQERSDSR